ncbi:MAG: TIGR02452 family protein [Oscillospiraceae bacterium]|nr:TIGR02452 family protein [Oscillospiraceae bacterium]
MDVRLQLSLIFEDTMRFIRSTPMLSVASASSVMNTVLYPEGKTPALPDGRPFGTDISVTKERSFQAAIRLRKDYPDAKIAVHNFASATNPGGGVTRGARAQEECLCRYSTLYPSLATPVLRESYYGFHRNRHDVRYTDACIYTPDVIICKSDTDFPERLPQQEWVTVDILTCAAPNLREKPYNAMNPGSGKPVQLSGDDLYSLHLKRARHLLSVAAANQDEIIVLGAFGCGAFRNDPAVVAKAYKDVLPEFHGLFRHICFAVFCTDRELRNYQAFSEALQ